MMSFSPIALRNVCLFLRISNTRYFQNSSTYKLINVIKKLLIVRESVVCVVVLHLRYVSKVMWGRSVNLITLFLGRFRPAKRLTSTLCTYFRQ